jgi:HD-GYP domain-containing protein (c-di-GMP phosphodiesterase class II)
MAGLAPNPIAQAGSLLMRVKELEEQHLAYRDSVICAFNQLLDLKDISTGVHSTRLAEWAIRVARKSIFRKPISTRWKSQRYYMTLARSECPTRS